MNMNFFLKKSLYKNFTTKLKKAELFSNTLLHPLSNLRLNLEQRDAVLVGNQSIRWTIKELDTYSDAFANYLIEAGYRPGNKMLLWTDINHSAETLTTMIGGIKAGLSIVHSEFENHEDITKNLLASQADLLLISPYAKYENSTRLEALTNYIPELAGNHFKYGDSFKSASFPNLRQVIQISHKTIHGTQKFKNCLSYLKPMMTNISLPQLSSESTAFSFYSNGKEVNNLTHGSALTKVNEFSSSINIGQYCNVLNASPIFYPSSFLAFISSLSNKNYNIIPGSYKMESIFELSSQNSCNTVFLESGLMDIQLPKKKIDELANLNSNVQKVVILCNQNDYQNYRNKPVLKELFNNAQFYYLNENTLNLLG